MQRITFWLSLLMIFAIPWENSAKFEGLGSLAKLTGVAAAGMWIATLARRGELPKLGRFHVLALLFVLWNGLSLLWSVDIAESTLPRALTYVQTLILVVLLWDVYRTPAALRAGMQAYVFGAYVCFGLLAEVYFFEGGADARRLTASGVNPNVAAFGMVLAIPMAWYLAYIDRVSPAGFLRRWLNLLYIPLAAFATIMAGARSAMVSALLAFGFMAISLGRLRPMARLSFVTMAILAPMIALPYISFEKMQRMASTVTEIDAGRFGGRDGIWSEGYEMIAERPLLGIGSGAYTVAAVETRKAPHNFVVSILVELGLFGFLLFSAVLASTGLDAFKQDRWLCRLWLTMLVMWMLNAAVHNYEDKKHTWVFFSFVAIGAGLARREPYEASEAVGALNDSIRNAANEPSTTPAIAPTAT